MEKKKEIKNKEAIEDPLAHPRNRYYAEILVELKDGENSDDAWEQLDDLLWQIANERVTLLIRPATLEEEKEWLDTEPKSSI